MATGSSTPLSRTPGSAIASVERGRPAAQPPAVEQPGGGLVLATQGEGGGLPRFAQPVRHCGGGAVAVALQRADLDVGRWLVALAAQQLGEQLGVGAAALVGQGSRARRRCPGRRAQRSSRRPPPGAGRTPTAPRRARWCRGRRPASRAPTSSQVRRVPTGRAESNSPSTVTGWPAPAGTPASDARSNASSRSSCGGWVAQTASSQPLRPGLEGQPPFQDAPQPVDVPGEHGAEVGPVLGRPHVAGVQWQHHVPHGEQHRPEEHEHHEVGGRVWERPHQPGRQGVREGQRQADTTDEGAGDLVPGAPVHQLVAEQRGHLVVRFGQHGGGDDHVSGVRAGVAQDRVVLHQQPGHAGQAEPSGAVVEDRAQPCVLAAAGLARAGDDQQAGFEQHPVERVEDPDQRRRDDSADQAGEQREGLVGDAHPGQGQHGEEADQEADGEAGDAAEHPAGAGQERLDQGADQRGVAQHLGHLVVGAGPDGEEPDDAER